MTDWETILKTNRAIPETCDLWGIWPEWSGEMNYSKPKNTISKTMTMTMITVMRRHHLSQQKVATEGGAFFICLLFVFVLTITVEMAHLCFTTSAGRGGSMGRMQPEGWLLCRLWINVQTEFQTDACPAPPVTAVRGSGILWSFSFSPLSLSLGMRKSSRSRGRLEMQVFRSSLDSRSVGCSSTVRKEPGLQRVV